MRKLLDDHITLELLIQYLEGSVNDAVKSDIDLWLNASPENRIFLDRLRDAWENRQDLLEIRDEVRIKDWKIISDAISEKTGERKVATIKSISRWYMRAAAILLLFLTTTLGFFVGRDQTHRVSLDKGFHELVVPQGEKSQLILSDGSKVWVNAGSTLRFPNVFNAESRDVWLDGEAYFEVSHDRTRLFLVHTSDLDVKVHGTKFNVKAYSSENIIEATLIEGSVSLETRNVFNQKRQEVFLQPFHKAIYLKKKVTYIDRDIAREVSEPLQIKKIIISNAVQVEPAISWREGKLVFVDESFDNIALKLERRFGVNIIIQSDQIRKIKYTGVLKNISIEQALKAIQLSAHFNYKIQDNTIVISEKKPD
jgi:transmembrane sensor